jgi:lysine 2,3-aminomutase
MGAICGSTEDHALQGESCLPSQKMLASPRLIGENDNASPRSTPDQSRDVFWRHLPGWTGIEAADFSDPLWQERNAVTRPDQLQKVLSALLADELMADLEAGLRQAPMAMRITPYILALIDWAQPRADPLRRQFLPLASEMTPSHPLLGLDSLAETSDSPVPGLVHRYPDRALFLATDRCPVYCRFCTRSYSVGDFTGQVTKQRNAPTRERWQAVFDYLRATPPIADVVISGGDCFRLKPSQIGEIGDQLLSIPHLRRIRFATKGLAILPMKITHDGEWTDTLCRLAERGRRQRVEVCFHTHFNHPNEITHFTEAAAALLFERGVPMRNQSVLLRGVNDSPAVMAELIKRLSDLHVHPYYVYACDLVEGTEDLRITLSDVCRIEKAVRGVTAGYNTPAFVVDAPGGGGKRIAHSHEIYDREIGLAVYTAPAVKPGAYHVYPDPLRGLAPEIQSAWADPGSARDMIDSVIAAARAAGG